MIRGASKEVDRICGSPANRSELLHHTGCLNHHKDKLDKCMSGYIKSVDGLEAAAVRDKIPGSCCTFYSFSQCVDQQLRQQSVAPTSTDDRNTCSDASRDYINRMVSTFASEVTSLMCRQTPKGSNSCQQILRPLGGSSTTTARSGRSLLVPFVKAFGSFNRA